VSRPVLQIVVASTRPGRSGPAFARWFAAAADSDGGFDVEVVDLAEVALPFLDEPDHPRLGRYRHEHTKRWSATVDRADAFVFCTPEYNHGYPATLKNAIDFLHAEWADKPVGFLSYGGVSAGTRSVQQLKQVVVGLRMVPVVESVTVPFASSVLGPDGEVSPTGAMDNAADAMLAELARLTARLRPVPAAS
jgi:NAD(P)H-dependent FMN reductase